MMQNHLTQVAVWPSRLRSTSWWNRWLSKYLVYDWWLDWPNGWPAWLTSSLFRRLTGSWPIVWVEEDWQLGPTVVQKLGLIVVMKASQADDQKIDEKTKTACLMTKRVIWMKSRKVHKQLTGRGSEDFQMDAELSHHYSIILTADLTMSTVR
jgi:hypothetical protein